MRKYLLPEKGQFYKANLHCHSTVSDGAWTVEEIKERYLEYGYSIVAFTDHDLFITHNELKDENFLPLNGYELGFNGDKVCHICAIALDPSINVQKIFYKTVFEGKNNGKLRFDSERDYIDRRHNVELINGIIKQLREYGFFVTYNHPVWSFETKDEYCNYHGMHAMEIVNYGCVVEGYDDHNGNIYDQMLRNHEKIYCVATDDNHNLHSVDSPKCDSFGGFTMIKADKLEYGAISRALLNGDFYSSEGPRIDELYYENGRIYIKTSEAARIVMTTELRHYRCATAKLKDDTISEADFAIIPDKTGAYVRFTVTDTKGKEANTNAIFLSDFLS